jgi:hypothetical protein
MATDRVLARVDVSPRIARRPRFVATVCTLVAILATASWSTAAVLMARRGFDITDEGFYVLSYRWWNENLHSFTGAQFLYGPVFDLLRHNVAALRLFRLASILCVAVLFATAFMNWLAVHEPRARPSQWRVAGAAAIVASTGMVYAWLPLSPGYDDIAALGGLAITAVMLSTARRWQAGQVIPAWLPAVGGVLAALQFLAKWSSVVNVAVFGATVLLVLAGSGWRQLARYAGYVIAGAVVTAALVHLFVVPLDRALPELWFVNRAVIDDEGGSPSTRLTQYLSDVRSISVHAIRLGYPVMAVALAARLARPRRLTWPWVGVVLATFAWFGLRAVDEQGWQGGPANALAYTTAVLALVITSTLAGVRLRTPPRSELGPLLMLAVIPLSQALGTNNHLWMIAGNAFGAWFALLVWFAARSTARPASALVTWLASGSIVVLVAVIVCTGLLIHPYRTTGYSQDTATVPGLVSLRISPPVARQYTAVRRALRPHLNTTGPTPIFAFDRMSGLVLIVGGIAAGELWNGTDRRAGTVLKRACEQGEVSRANPPILLLKRDLGPHAVEALTACGLKFPSDFDELRLRRGPPGLRIYVPR